MQNKMEVSDQTLCGHQPNFLILDEPTNHLDVQTIEALGNAILKYKVSGWKLDRVWKWRDKLNAVVLCNGIRSSKFRNYFQF